MKSKPDRNGLDYDAEYVSKPMQAVFDFKENSNAVNQRERMSKYQKLRDAYTAYKDAESQYVQENETLAYLIVYGLRGYLGMPQYFNSITRDRTEVKSYLPLYGVDDDGNTTDARYLKEAVNSFSDGSFKFAFGVVLERSEGSFPKHNLIHHVYCKRAGKAATITISGVEYQCQFDGKECADIAKVHAGIFAKLQDWLTHRHGDGRAITKIGFQMRET